MLTIDSIVLYVEDIKTSTEFYTELFSCEAKSLSPTFVSINLVSGPLLELKQRAETLPPSDTTGGGTELSIGASSKESVMEIYDAWAANGVVCLQPPTELIFGTTFVVLDPDKHRIRVFSQ
jgi:predicted enzyme related to lactoylglutathione lyase